MIKSPMLEKSIDIDGKAPAIVRLRRRVWRGTAGLRRQQGKWHISLSLHKTVVAVILGPARCGYNSSYLEYDTTFD